MTTEAVDRAIRALTETFDAKLEVLRVEIAAQRDYFLAIIEEQRRGLSVAEQEREKAARALAVELGRTIEEGDRNLREHITQQVHQIREALISADKLEISRYNTLDQKLGLITSAAAAAIAKAEEATEKRFETADVHVKQIAADVTKALPREVADAQYQDLSKRVAANTDKINKIT